MAEITIRVRTVAAGDVEVSRADHFDVPDADVERRRLAALLNEAVAQVRAAYAITTAHDHLPIARTGEEGA